MRELLSLSSYEAIVEKIVAKLFRLMDERQKKLSEMKKHVGISILRDLQNKLDINLNPEIEKNARPYLALRHVLVHDDGCPDPDFWNQYPQFSRNGRSKKIKLSHSLIVDAYCNVEKLILEIDQRLEEKGLV